MSLGQRGFSLTEMLITTALSCIMFAALVSVVSQVIETQRNSTAALRLENEIFVISHTLMREISRSGFLEHSAATFIAANGEHPIDIANSLSLGTYPGESVSSCILFRYDSNKSGQFDTHDPNELYGFRVRDRAIEMRMNGKGCEETGWHDLSDAGEFRFNQLTFELLPTTLPQIRLTISASLAADPAVLRTYQYRIPLENG